MIHTNYRTVNVTLVGNGDHGYYEVDLVSVPVVLQEDGPYVEYHGDEYLEEGDEVVLAEVAY